MCSGVLANGNAACPYKKRHKFIRDKRIPLFLRRRGKTGRKEEDKVEGEKTRKTNTGKEEKETVFSSIYNGRVISGNPKERPNMAGFLQFEKTILFRISEDEKRNHKESLNRYSCHLDKT